MLAFNYSENEFFVVYSAIIGLCLLLGVTGLIDFSRSVNQPPHTPAIRLASVGLVLAAVIGYGYWISEVVTALLDDTVAQSLTGTGLPASAARAFDMAIMLPLAAFGGANRWKGRHSGVAIAAVMSTILIGLTVIVMEIGLVNTTDRDLDVVMIAGFGFAIGLSLTTAAITYRALARSTARSGSPAPQIRQTDWDRPGRRWQAGRRQPRSTTLAFAEPSRRAQHCGTCSVGQITGVSCHSPPTVIMGSAWPAVSGLTLPPTVSSCLTSHRSVDSLTAGRVSGTHRWTSVTS